MTIHMHDDILIEIFFRLPPRSLIRFKSVSKQWISILSDPKFRQMYNRFNGNLTSAVGVLLHHLSVDEWYEFVPFFASQFALPPLRKLNFSKYSPNFVVLSSCNGLLLCYNSFAELRYVCNPTTTEFSVIPPCEFIKYYGMILAFDPSKSNGYKIVFVIRSLRLVDQIMVYSSITGSWSVIRECPYTWNNKVFGVSVSFRNGVYWNGAINWVGYDELGDFVYFNVDTYVFEIKPKPPIRGSSCQCYFGESHGHLHYSQFCEPADDIIIYEMKRDYSEWFVKYRVDLLKIISANHVKICPIFAIIRGKEEDDSFMGFLSN